MFVVREIVGRDFNCHVMLRGFLTCDVKAEIFVALDGILIESNLGTTLIRGTSLHKHYSWHTFQVMVPFDRVFCEFQT